jgi:hypothetical protein
MGAGSLGRVTRRESAVDTFFLSVESTPEVLEALKAHEFPTNIEVGEPTPRNALNDALDSPLGAEEIRQLLEIVDLVFKDGADILAFVTALVGFVKHTDAGSAAIIDSHTARQIAVVDAKSNPQTVADTVARSRGR